jgi:hypothetical protein
MTAPRGIYVASTWHLRETRSGAVHSTVTQPQTDPGTDSNVALGLQAQLDAINAESPAKHNVPFFLASYRHACVSARQSAQAGKGVSTNIDCPEKYLESDDGTHAIIYREGTCKRCRERARSTRGRVVLTSERPPAQGRVTRD